MLLSCFVKMSTLIGTEKFHYKVAQEHLGLAKKKVFNIQKNQES